MSATTVYRLGLKDAAAAFGISYTAIYEAVKAGDLPAIRPMRSWLVVPADVEAWLVDLSDRKLEEEGAA